MLELFMVLSAIEAKYSGLVVVGTLLIFNAVLGFMQAPRPANVVGALC